MDLNESFNNYKTKAEQIFKKNELLSCPYFSEKIRFNSDGLHHLQFSARRERNRKEQILKLKLLPLAVSVLKKAGTLQQYRKELSPVGKSDRSGMMAMKRVQYWAFEAIVGQDKLIKIRVIVRRVGDGKVIFWSVMLLETEQRRMGKTEKDD